MIVGLDHLQLAIPPGGEDRARRFHRGLLGLTEAAKPHPLARRGGCWFEGPGVAVHLGVEVRFLPARKAHPAFLVADLDELYQRLEQAGVPLTTDSALPDVRRFYAADPFGNRIELIQDGAGLLSRG